MSRIDGNANVGDASAAEASSADLAGAQTAGADAPHDHEAAAAQRDGITISGEMSATGIQARIEAKLAEQSDGGLSGQDVVRLDRDVVYPDGTVDHAASAKSNLESVGLGLEFMAGAIPRALAGRGAIDPDVRVPNAGMYVMNLAVGIGSTAITPAIMAKDMVDAAVHGVMAGFQKLFG